MINGESELYPSQSDNAASEADVTIIIPDNGDDAMPQPKRPKPKRRYTRKPKTKILSIHHKLKQCLLKSLIVFSPDPDNFPQILENRMLQFVVPEAVSDYLQTFAEKSESHFVKLQKDETFQNLQGWSDYMTELYAKPTKNELVLSLKAIAETEKHPEPATVNGVNFKQIYHCLADLMMGYPIPEIDPRSVKLILELYDELMQTVSTVDCSNDMESLTAILMKDSQADDNAVQHTGLDLLLQDREFNPLQMSLDLLTNRDSLKVDVELSLMTLKTDSNIDLLE